MPATLQAGTQVQLWTAARVIAKASPVCLLCCGTQAHLLPCKRLVQVKQLQCWRWRLAQDGRKGGWREGRQGRLKSWRDEAEGCFLDAQLLIQGHRLGHVPHVCAGTAGRSQSTTHHTAEHAAQGNTRSSFSCGTVVKTAVRIPLHAVSPLAKGSAGLGRGLVAGTGLAVVCMRALLAPAIAAELSVSKIQVHAAAAARTYAEQLPIKQACPVPRQAGHLSQAGLGPVCQRLSVGQQHDVVGNVWVLRVSGVQHHLGTLRQQRSVAANYTSGSSKLLLWQLCPATI